MEASGRNSFEGIAEEIARSFHTNLNKFDPELKSRHVRIWDEETDEHRAPIVATFKKLLIDEVIEPGRSVMEGDIK